MALTLTDLTLNRLEVRCRVCKRRGRYRTQNLIAKHGADFPLPELADLLAEGCEEIPETSFQKCSVYFPGLVQP